MIFTGLCISLNLTFIKFQILFLGHAEKYVHALNTMINNSLRGISITVNYFKLNEIHACFIELHSNLQKQIICYFSNQHKEKKKS